MEMHHRDFKKHREEFHRLHRHISYFRPIFIALNLLIWYLIFRYTGFKGLSVFFAFVISMIGIFQLFFFRRIENRILKPMDKFKKGVEEITGGNYDVEIECNVSNDISVLAGSFNEMARKLKEGEKIKADYEENRKALIANITHDLKTPITSVQGYIEAMLDRDDISREDLNRYLKIILSNTSYMNRLIDDLFLFSKLDMDKLEFSFEATGIKPFMGDLMEEFRLELEERKAVFIYDDRLERDCFVKLDGKRINQALRNILGNSVKYGPEKGLTVKAQLYREDEHVLISLEDNGPGIPDDKLAYIFDRFYRIDSERTKDLMSTGLGLAIAKELVAAHGGGIEAANPRVGLGGTRFIVRLPVYEEAKEQTHE